MRKMEEDSSLLLQSSSALKQLWWVNVYTRDSSRSSEESELLIEKYTLTERCEQSDQQKDTDPEISCNHFRLWEFLYLLCIWILQHWMISLRNIRLTLLTQGKYMKIRDSLRVEAESSCHPQPQEALGQVIVSTPWNFSAGICLLQDHWGAQQ